LNFIESKRVLLDYLTKIRAKLNNKLIENNTEIKGAHIVKVVFVRIDAAGFIVLGSGTSQECRHKHWTEGEVL
jgi:hypothetical protein